MSAPLYRACQRVAARRATRGLCREAAAEYVGVGTTKFDEMVRDGRMPKPRQIDARRIWDRNALDAAFEALPTEAEGNPWDEA